MDPYWSGGTLKAPAVQKIRSQPRAGNTRDGVGSHPGPRLADLPCGVTTPTRWEEQPGSDAMVCGGQECGGWHTVGPCRTIRRLTARVRAPPWRNSEGRESAGSTTGSIASAWSSRHLEATDAPGTTWWPSPTGGLSTAAASCADAALNRTPDGVRAPGAGFGCGGRSDASAWIPTRFAASYELRLDYRSTRFAAGYWDNHGNAFGSRLTEVTDGLRTSP